MAATCQDRHPYSLRGLSVGARACPALASKTPTVFGRGKPAPLRVALAATLHVSAAFDGAAKRTLVGIFEIAAHGQAAGEAGDLRIK